MTLLGLVVSQSRVRGMSGL